MMNIKTWMLKNLELVFWIAAVFLLFIMNAEDNTTSLCFFHWLGFDHCPGCGIGHSIHAALHFQFANSFKQHPFGIVAILIIFNRIRQLFFTPKQLLS